MHDKVKVTRDQRTKPHVIAFYDVTKGGVDVVDLHSSSITTRVKSKGWTINAFSFSLDTVRTNARTLLQEVDSNKLSNFHFTWNLGKAIVMSLIRKRYEHSNGIPHNVMTKIKSVLGIVNVPARLPKPDKSASGGRCELCLDAIRGTQGYKTKKDRLNNHLKTFCHKCNLTVCVNHSMLTCDTCSAAQVDNN